MSTDPVDLDTQSNTMREIEQARQNRIRTRTEDTKWLMTSKRGRRIVWATLAEAGVYQSSFNPDPIQMAFNQGLRDSGLKLLAEIVKTCPDLHNQMILEGGK